MIGILNYGLGNVGALKNIFDESNIKVKLISKSDDINSFIDKLIIPGVGSYDNAIKKIRNQNSERKIRKF